MAHEAGLDSFCGQGQSRDADPWVCYCSWNLQDKSRGGGRGGSQQPTDSSKQLLTHGWPGKSGPHSTKQIPKLSCSLSFVVLIWWDQYTVNQKNWGYIWGPYLLSFSSKCCCSENFRLQSLALGLRSVIPGCPKVWCWVLWWLNPRSFGKYIRLLHRFSVGVNNVVLARRSMEFTQIL